MPCGFSKNIHTAPLYFQGLKRAIQAVMISLGWPVVPEQREQHTANFRVLGMSCASCVAALESQIGNLPGIINVSVSLLDQSLKVRAEPPAFISQECLFFAFLASSVSQAVHDPVDAPIDVIKEAIEDIGYDAELLLPVSVWFQMSPTPSRWGSSGQRFLLCISGFGAGHRPASGQGHDLCLMRRVH